MSAKLEVTTLAGIWKRGTSFADRRTCNNHKLKWNKMPNWIETLNHEHDVWMGSGWYLLHINAGASTVDNNLYLNTSACLEFLNPTVRCDSFCAQALKSCIINEQFQCEVFKCFRHHNAVHNIITLIRVVFFPVTGINVIFLISFCNSNRMFYNYIHEDHFTVFLNFSTCYLAKGISKQDPEANIWAQ